MAPSSSRYSRSHEAPRPATGGWATPPDGSPVTPFCRLEIGGTPPLVLLQVALRSTAQQVARFASARQLVSGLPAQHADSTEMGCSACASRTRDALGITGARGDSGATPSAADQQFHRLRSLLLLSRRLILRRKFREKRAQARPRARRVTVFIAKVEVESHPFPVVGTLPLRNPGAFQPPIKIVQYFS